MNLLEAIKKARKRKTNVYVPFGWSYTSIGPGNWHNVVHCAPGAVDPHWLLTIIGQIKEAYLFLDTYEVQQSKIEVTKDALRSAFGLAYTDPENAFKAPDTAVINAMLRHLGLED